MNTYGNERALTISPPDAYTPRQLLDNRLQFQAGVSACINSHAIMIDDLNKRMGDTMAFMEWVGNTHPNVWKQYKAIKDLEEASK